MGEKLVSAGALVDQLENTTVDDLRRILSRLEESERVVKAVLRERLALARRNAAWEAREKLASAAG